jgi:hypothetical protein
MCPSHGTAPADTEDELPNDNQFPGEKYAATRLEDLTVPDVNESSHCFGGCATTLKIRFQLCSHSNVIRRRIALPLVREGIS